MLRPPQRSVEANYERFVVVDQAALFASHLAQKTYQAITSKPARGEPSESWSIKNYLAKDRSAGHAQHVVGRVPSAT